MQNNTIIELADATMVLAFGSELPQFLVNEMRKNERPIRWYDGTAMTSEEFMGSVEQTLLNERCRKVVLDAGYKVEGVFLAYDACKYLMAEDESQWWYIKDVGDHQLAVVGYKVWDEDKECYKSLFNYSDCCFEYTLRSSFDESGAGIILGKTKDREDGRTLYFLRFFDHITGEPYYITLENYKRYYAQGRKVSEEEGVCLVAGNLVQAMTNHDEYIRDTSPHGLMCLVDIWGNISADEEPNERWIMARI